MEIDIILNEFASPQEALELGLMAERYGARGVWSSNYGWSRDPFFTLSLLAHQSSRIRLGPMAVSPAELHPLKMANLLFSLNELSRGRAMIMVGGGGAVLQAIGGKRERMIGHARECLEILGCAGPGGVGKLAEICAAVVLAGEVSLASAVLAGDWVTSHERLGRNR